MSGYCGPTDPAGTDGPRICALPPPHPPASAASPMIKAALQRRVGFNSNLGSSESISAINININNNTNNSSMTMNSSDDNINNMIPNDIVTPIMDGLNNTTTTINNNENTLIASAVDICGLELASDGSFLRNETASNGILLCGSDFKSLMREGSSRGSNKSGNCSFFSEVSTNGGTCGDMGEDFRLNASLNNNDNNNNNDNKANGTTDENGRLSYVPWKDSSIYGTGRNSFTDAFIPPRSQRRHEHQRKLDGRRSEEEEKRKDQNSDRGMR
ncbi:hypothetical protein LSM04_008708 [Trypanosoma melophagium]|uniref:uncharacterized protein n=1 Tax=Trypanosoma melophagium TaxID=715481 RepID=UPI00351A72E1|nr:hypothetical protein LSM04_008708 [Trypanosoma melophagium]